MTGENLLPEGFEALVDKLAEAHAPAPVVKAPRVTMLSEAHAALDAGNQFPPLAINSLANASYAKRADRVWKLATAGDLAGLEALQVTGVNTYARAVAGYREVAIAWVKRWKAPAPVLKVVPDTPDEPPPGKPKAKKAAAKPAKAPVAKPAAKVAVSKAGAALAKRRATKAGQSKGVKKAA